MSGDATTLLTSQIGAAAACAYFMNLIQKWKALPWITQHTEQINFAVRAVLAAGSAIGINTVWNPTDHSLLITGLAVVPILHGVWHWFTQFAMTHLTGKILESKQEQQPVKPLSLGGN